MQGLLEDKDSRDDCGRLFYAGDKHHAVDLVIFKYFHVPVNSVLLLFHLTGLERTLVFEMNADDMLVSL